METRQAGIGPDTAVDLAQARYRDWWLHHPVLGDPSWDAFEREPGNPIYTGAAPYEWPVNGFLFHDPLSGRWYAYISLYPRGYWPPGGVLIVREEAGAWQPAGMALTPDPTSFEGDGQRGGGLVDVSLVYEAGRYHMIYGWCDPDNQRGGLAYAWAGSPEGPFQRAPFPLHDDARQPALLGRYARAYAPTLIRRARDWMILHMMSTPRNAGGTWALACMTATRPEGPYSPPRLLLMPQSDRFHPPLAEFYPQFVHEGWVYAPATSVALNRSFQVIYRAPVEQAHLPEAWEIDQYGSVWHSEPAEGQGLWGQTFSGQVGPDGWLRAFYPCRTRDDVGAIHMARRPWAQAYRDGFTLAAPNGPALAILKRTVGDFQARMVARANGEWAFCWGCGGPLGPSHPFADASLHPLTRTRRLEWRRGPAASLVSVDERGNARLIATPAPDWAPERTEQIEIERTGDMARLVVDGRLVWQGAAPAMTGRIELLAEAGTTLNIEQFELSARTQPDRQCWLSTEALAGAADEPAAWTLIEAEHFRHGVGHVSARPGARAKWNVIGSRVWLYAPRAPGFGRCDLRVDGERVATLDFAASARQPSSLVWFCDLPHGPHALVIEAQEAGVPCDLIEVESM